jgi:hypothetical protein
MIFKLLVNRLTVASVIQSRRYRWATCMLNILQGARKNAEWLQMIYLKGQKYNIPKHGGQNGHILFNIYLIFDIEICFLLVNFLI